MKKIKIAFVASTFTVGGAEMVMQELISRLDRDRYHSHILFLTEPGPIGEELFRAGVNGAAFLKRFRFDPFVLFRLTRILRRLSPDILFALDHRDAMFWGRLASFLAKVPVRIVPCHSTGKYGGKKNFNYLDHLLMGMTDVIVAISRTHARYLRDVEGIEARKIEVIENGIDVGRLTHIDTVRVSALRRELGIGDDEKVVIMVAALRPEKAHEVLLQAAQRLVGKSSNIKFLVVGGGSRQAMLEKMADEMGLGGYIHFLGRRDDVPELLHLSDVMVLPSHGVVETLPLSVLEAMAAGVPVVATAVGSLPEMITDGENGKLIPTGDPDALAGAIESIVTDEGASQTMAEQARERVADRYSVERMVVGYADLFENVLRSKNACP